MKSMKKKHTTMDSILDTDLLKQILDKVSEEVEDTDVILVIYRNSEGEIHWRTNCHCSEAVGLCDVVHYKLLHAEDD